MAYGGVDRQRFSYLIRSGATELELSRFFSDCRLQLIKLGGKVQNLPHSSKERVRVLVGQLPSSTDAVVRSWFQKNLTMVDPEDADSLVELYEGYEKVGGGPPEQDAQRYARSFLVHLFKESPAPRLLAFLRTPIPSLSVQPAMDGKDKALTADSVASSELLIQRFSQILPALVEGRAVDEWLDQLPNGLAGFVSGLQAAAAGKFEEARAIQASLTEHKDAARALEEFIKRAAIRRLASPSEAALGLRFVEALRLETQYEIETDEVLAKCVLADRATAVFVTPLFVIRQGVPLALDEEKRREIFPESGDLMAFAGANYPKQPKRGEIGVWKVALNENQAGRTKFHIVSEKRPVYEVRSIPFSSDQYDSVREYLREFGQRNAGSNANGTLFALTDGLIIGSRSEWLDFSRSEIYESGLASWNQLDAYQVEDRALIIGPLPKETGVYECATLSYALRKVIKAGANGKVPGGLTKAQVRDLSQYLDSEAIGVDRRRVERIRQELGGLDRYADELGSLTDELLSLPTVAARIESAVQESVTRRLREKQDLQTEISRLSKEKADWEERVKRQQAENRKLRDETTLVVKSAFERARDDGVAALAQVAIFQAIAGQPTPSAPYSAPAVADRRRPWHSLDHSSGDVVTAMAELGVPKVNRNAVAALGAAALNAGLVVCVRGIAARPIVRTWASLLGRAGIFDVPVGLLDSHAVAEMMQDEANIEALAMLDGNVSAIELYARPLLDKIVSRVASDAAARPFVLISLSQGVAALTLPDAVRKICVVCDLDSPISQDSSEEFDAALSEAVDPDDGWLGRLLWRPALRRLQGELCKLEPSQALLAMELLKLQSRGP
jgi:hypothetical protein